MKTLLPIRIDVSLLFLYLFNILFVFNESKAGKVQMRIVRETANYGYFGNNVEDVDNHSKLSARVSPAEFSGPALLSRLIGKCYGVTLERYRYQFCPFQNMTQHETPERWNSYQGVLGVWSHWNITNNTFSSMLLIHGDDCGTADRNVEVYLHCGVKEALTNVTEPQRCQYKAIFQTRFVCHADSLLVYPRLNSRYQREWDHLFTSYKHGHLTEKGYSKALQKLFHEVGYVKLTETSKSKNKSTADTSVLANQFTDLATCNLEHEKLKKTVAELNDEIEALKLMLNVNRMRNKTRRIPKN